MATQELLVSEITEVLGEKRTKGAKLVRCKETGKVYASGLDAANALGVDNSSISAACLGKIKSCKGFHFEYITKIPKTVSETKTELDITRKAKLFDEWRTAEAQLVEEKANHTKYMALAATSKTNIDALENKIKALREMH